VFFWEKNTVGNDILLCWVLEFLNMAIPGLIAAFGSAAHYLTVTSDEDLFLL